jgi:ABC-type uncharacterized transport system substrate-binding protein
MTAKMKRRDFITLLGGAAVALPLAARAQQPTMPVIGILAVASPEANAIRLRAIREGLRTAGYVEGQNVKIEYRWAEAHTGRLRALAAELVSRQVAVIVASSTPSALAAKAATGEIPIVFGIAIDPVELGLVASLNRPGGNVTGVTSLNIEVAPKRLELMHELLPSVTSMALLVNPAVPALAEPVSRSSQAAAQALGLQLHAVHASAGTIVRRHGASVRLHVRDEQPVRHALLEIPDHGRLAPRDRDRQRLALSGPELDHVGAVILRAEDHDAVLAGRHRLAVLIRSRIT